MGLFMDERFFQRSEMAHSGKSSSRRPLADEFDCCAPFGELRKFRLSGCVPGLAPPLQIATQSEVSEAHR